MGNNYPIMTCASIDVLSIGMADKRYLQTWLVCDIVEIPQSRMATTASRPPVRYIRDTAKPRMDFDQSVVLTSYRVLDYVFTICGKFTIYWIASCTHFLLTGPILIIKPMR